MDKFSLKELRDIASSCNLANRSQYKKKAELYEALKAKLGESGLTKSSDSKEGCDGLRQTKLSFFTAQSERTETSKPKSKPRLEVIDTYDFVVVQFVSTKSLFPITFKDETGVYRVNKHICYFFGHNDDYEGMWAKCNDQQGPIGLNGRNVPFTIAFTSFGGIFFNNFELEGDDIHCRVKPEGEEEILVKAEDFETYEITPTIDPKIVGYHDLLEEFAIYNSEINTYSIEEYEEFAGKIAKRSRKWNFLPEYMTDIYETLDNNDLKGNNTVIFADIGLWEIEKFKTYILKSEHDISKGIKRVKNLITNGHKNIMYIETC